MDSDLEIAAARCPCGPPPNGNGCDRIKAEGCAGGKGGRCTCACHAWRALADKERSAESAADSFDAAFSREVLSMQAYVNRLYSQQLDARETLGWREPSKWTRLRWRINALARRPFEWLRYRLVSWLGCDCENH